jgi:uncharacterized Zn-finger protein
MVADPSLCRVGTGKRPFAMESDFDHFGQPRSWLDQAATGILASVVRSKDCPYCGSDETKQRVSTHYRIPERESMMENVILPRDASS